MYVEQLCVEEAIRKFLKESRFFLQYRKHCDVLSFTESEQTRPPLYLGDLVLHDHICVVADVSAIKLARGDFELIRRLRRFI